MDFVCLFFFFLRIYSTSTSKLNVLVTKLHEFLAHTAVEDSGQTPTSKDTEGTVESTGEGKHALSRANKIWAAPIFSGPTRRSPEENSTDHAVSQVNRHVIGVVTIIH